MTGCWIGDWASPVPSGCRWPWSRVVSRDNTVVMGGKTLQIAATRFRGTLAGCSVTVCEHLDQSWSIRYGPHVVGRYNAQGWPCLPEAKQNGKTVEKTSGGKVLRTFPRTWKSRPNRGIPTFPQSRRRYSLNLKSDISCAQKSGPFNLLRTVLFLELFSGTRRNRWYLLHREFRFQITFFPNSTDRKLPRTILRVASNRVSVDKSRYHK
jgi:hypothetical protein